MNFRKTLLSDNLQKKLNKQAPGGWMFMVSESKPETDEDERVVVDFFSTDIQSDRQDIPFLRKAFYTEEVQRKKDLNDFANVIIKQIQVVLEK